MIWLTVIAVLVFVYSFYAVVLGEPATSPYEDERAKLPAHQYAYASKLSANYTRKSWRMWAGANLVLAVFLLGRLGEIRGFWAYLLFVLEATVLVRVVWIELRKPYLPDKVASG